jgi:hypothetical protein
MPCGTGRSINRVETNGKKFQASDNRILAAESCLRELAVEVQTLCKEKWQLFLIK